MDVSGGMNCSRYVGLSSFMLLEVLFWLKLPRIFMFSFMRCRMGPADEPETNGVLSLFSNERYLWMANPLMPLSA